MQNTIFLTIQYKRGPKFKTIVTINKYKNVIILNLMYFTCFLYIPSKIHFIFLLYSHKNPRSSDEYMLLRN